METFIENYQIKHGLFMISRERKVNMDFRTFVLLPWYMKLFFSVVPFSLGCLAYYYTKKTIEICLGNVKKEQGKNDR